MSKFIEFARNNNELNKLAAIVAIGSTALVGCSSNETRQKYSETYTTVVVKPGDTVSGIVQDACPSFDNLENLEGVKEIVIYNNRPNNHVSAGDSYSIPANFCEVTLKNSFNKLG